MPINSTKQSLLNLPRSVKRSLVISVDVFSCGLSVWLAFGLRLDHWGHIGGQQWIVFLIASSFSFPLFVSFGLYRAIFRYIGPLLSLLRALLLSIPVYFLVFLHSMG